MNRTVVFALRQTLPILFGYVFIGIAFGMVMQEAGYPWPWALAASVFVYAGSMQFVMAGFLTAATPLLTVALMTLAINSRHVFYGLSFVDKFRHMGKAYPYMVCSLTDETYSVLCACRYPPEVDAHRAALLIALFDQVYWVAGSVLGAVLGAVLPWDMTGIDFSMTALFTVILIDQVRAAEPRLPAVIGGASALLFLLLLGPDRFLLPALAVTAAGLLLLRARGCGKGASV